MSEDQHTSSVKTEPGKSVLLNIVKLQANKVKDLRRRNLELEEENKQISQKLLCQNVNAEVKNIQSSLSCEREFDQDEATLILNAQQDVRKILEQRSNIFLPTLETEEQKQWLCNLEDALKVSSSIIRSLLSTGCTRRKESGSKPEVASRLRGSSEKSGPSQPQSDLIDGELDGRDKSDEDFTSSSHKTCTKCRSKNHQVQELTEKLSDKTSELKEIQLELDRAVSAKLHAEEKTDIYKEQITDKTRMFEAVLNMQKQSTAAGPGYLLKQQLKTFEDDILTEREEKNRIKKENENYKRQLSAMNERSTHLMNGTRYREHTCTQQQQQQQQQQHYHHQYSAAPAVVASESLKYSTCEQNNYRHAQPNKMTPPLQYTQQQQQQHQRVTRPNRKIGFQPVYKTVAASAAYPLEAPPAAHYHHSSDALQYGGNHLQQALTSPQSVMVVQNSHENRVVGVRDNSGEVLTAVPKLSDASFDSNQQPTDNCNAQNHQFNEH